MNRTHDASQLEALFPELMKYHLTILERVNPCNQTYYYTEDQYFITYQFPINLLNFRRGISWKVKANVIGMPFSVCKQSYRGALTYLLPSLKGLTVVLNSENPSTSSGALTLSNYRFINRFESFDAYLEALRSSYRYRINKALKKGASLRVRDLAQADFNEVHYKLYEEVFNHSEDPLEKLTLAFFESYPSQFRVFEDPSGTPVAFIQTCLHDGELIFLFGGFKRSMNRTYDLYNNMLLELIRWGISEGAKSINMGQTADESKLKVGCVEERRYLSCYHSNPFLNGLLSKLVPSFGFKRYGVQHHVFKEAPHADFTV